MGQQQCATQSCKPCAVRAAPHSVDMQRRLLVQLSDLEAVWNSRQLPKELLALPLPAMQLLLDSQELYVSHTSTAQKRFWVICDCAAAFVCWGKTGSLMRSCSRCVLGPSAMQPNTAAEACRSSQHLAGSSRGRLQIITAQWHRLSLAEGAACTPCPAAAQCSVLTTATVCAVLLAFLLRYS